MIQLRDSRRKLTQNAVYFRLLIQLQLPQLVVQIDDRLGFDEHRGAAAALVVDDPRHPSPVLLFDRDHVSAVADGHDGVLQDRPLGIQDVIDLRPDRVILADDGPPDGPKLGAGVVGHFILGEDAPVDLRREIFVHSDDLHDGTDQGKLRYVVPLQEVHRPLCRLHVVEDLQKLRHGQDAALSRESRQRRNIIKTTYRQRSLR